MDERRHSFIRQLDGIVALAVAENEWMCKKRGEKDTEFVKRIVGAYIDIADQMGAHNPQPDIMRMIRKFDL